MAFDFDTHEIQEPDNNTAIYATIIRDKLLNEHNCLEKLNDGSLLFDEKRAHSALISLIMNHYEEISLLDKPLRVHLGTHDKFYINTDFYKIREFLLQMLHLCFLGNLIFDYTTIFKFHSVRPETIDEHIKPILLDVYKMLKGAGVDTRRLYTAGHVICPHAIGTGITTWPSLFSVLQAKEHIYMYSSL